MTNNPTIDGVSRELLQHAFNAVNYLSLRADDIGSSNVPIAEALRALLDAPAVERKEAVTMKRQYLTVPGLWIECGDDDPQAMTFYKQAPEVTALQSTIAQLQARVQELESGRGEPVAWRFKQRVWATGLSNYVWRDQLEDEKPNEDEIEVRDITPLFTAPPAPVATLWEICVRDEPGNPESPCEYVYASSEAERDSLIRQGGASVYAEYACLDATAALDKP